ncbi:amino acid-binding protein [Tsukamurella sp. 8F]|uniref:amino acid-binding protein n=1 Tax=Tsukamurella sp. 8F TaxID=3031961 RepID=UPI0023B95B0C|nr:amino acid-binding protein [Tsukamurella sp. 8F]MDF0586084.1 amino acid-binding protein [Tsukamurella sp. 8F]
MSYLLRVRLTDRPGSLGSLAVALGSVGADILSLDVVERGQDFVVDDLVVDLGERSLPDTLITAAEALDGVRVQSIRPYADMLDTHRELELIDHVATAGRDQLQMLVDQVPRTLRVGWCAVVANTTGAKWPLFGSSGLPETPPASLEFLPLPGPLALDGDADWVPAPWRDMDTTLAGAPLGAIGKAVIVGRPGGPDFRPSEVARLGYLAGIVATVLS